MDAPARWTLYGRPGSGSAVCEAILRLTGTPFEIVDFERWPEGEVPAALLAVNPLGQIPALVTPDGTALCESAAISILLADLHPGIGLAPAPDSAARGPFLQWMLHLAAGIYGTELRIYYPHRYTTDPAGADEVKAAANARLAFEWKVFADALGDRPFMLGERLSAVDLYAAMLISWADDIDSFFDAFPGLAALYRRVADHPGVAAVWQRHGMPVA